MKERFIFGRSEHLIGERMLKKRQKHSKDIRSEVEKYSQSGILRSCCDDIRTHTARFTFSIILDITPLQFQHEFLMNAPSALTYENIFIYLFIVQDAHRTMNETGTSHTMLNICTLGANLLATIHIQLAHSIRKMRDTRHSFANIPTPHGMHCAAPAV